MYVAIQQDITVVLILADICENYELYVVQVLSHGFNSYASLWIILGNNQALPFSFRALKQCPSIRS